MPSMNIVGPGEYDDVVVEIDCSPSFTAIVRNESGKYLLEIFNFDASQLEGFALGHKVEGNTVDLDEFLSLIQTAKSKLAYQSRRTD